MATHDKCNAVMISSKRFNPTRVIKIESEDEHGFKLRLQLNSGEDPFLGQYVTLSHRWRDAEIIQLKKGNLAAMTRDISFSSLPKTFQDAMIVTKKMLGISTICIDSLCIIQDSVDDWRHEAARMGQVYKHAWLNIGAITGIGPHSLHRERTESHPHDTLRNDTCWREWRMVLYTDTWEPLVTNVPLNRRGWVLQEQLLCPRMIHFGKDQILWECHELEAAELYPEAMYYLD